MNFDEYEKRYETQYAEFARIVRDILEKAIDGADGVPRPQSMQCRAKKADHLKLKLEARGLLDAPFIEDEIKDLAGARLIFYTNTDVDAFLSTRSSFLKISKSTGTRREFITRSRKTRTNATRPSTTP